MRVLICIAAALAGIAELWRNELQCDRLGHALQTCRDR